MEALPRLVFSDLDGTWLAADKSMPEVNGRALDALAELGTGFVPCTGRPVGAIPAELLAHPSVRYAASANGAVVWEVSHGAEAPELRRIAGFPLGVERALSLWDIVKDRRATFDLFIDGKVYSERSRWELMDELVADPGMRAYLKRVRQPVDETAPETLQRLCVKGGAELERVTVFWGEPAARDAVYAAVAADPSLTAVSSWQGNIEISDAQASKGHALGLICRHAGIDASECVAFGDSENDASMLAAAGLGVAVEGATEPARRAAAASCPSNEVGGPGLFLLELLGETS